MKKACRSIFWKESLLTGIETISLKGSEKMKKLFTVDDFMVAFISARGYGFVSMGTVLTDNHFFINENRPR